MNVACRTCGEAQPIEDDRHKGDPIVRCGECGRILYRDFAGGGRE